MCLIELKNITEIYENKTVFDDLDLTVKQGQQKGIKMSPEERVALFELLQGKVHPQNGNLKYRVKNIYVQRNDDGLYDNMSVKNYLRFFDNLVNNHIDLSRLLETFHLKDKLDIKISSLSILEKEFLQLIRICLFQPKLIFIESPLSKLSELDKSEYLKAIKYLRSDGITMVFTSNYLEELTQLSTEVYQCINKRLEVVNYNRSEIRLVSHQNGATNYFVPNEVDFIESINGISNLSVKSKYYPVTQTMDELEDLLFDYNFFRNHRSYLVNLNEVAQIISYSKNSYSLILKNKNQDKLPLSRAKLSNIKHILKM